MLIFFKKCKIKPLEPLKIIFEEQERIKNTLQKFDEFFPSR